MEVVKSAHAAPTTAERWRIVPAEGGSFIMQSCALAPGFLTYTVAPTRALFGGRWVQALDKKGEAAYDYSAGGSARRSVLWNIAEAEDGLFAITSADFGRPLTYADKGSPRGYFAQALTGADSRYDARGRWRNCALWALLEPPPPTAAAPTGST